MIKEINKDIFFIKDYLRELNIENFNYSKITNGVNSQIYKIWEGKNKFILKIYPKNDFLERDRIKSEYNFLTLLNKSGYSNVPKPVNWNFDNKWMLMSFLNGKHIRNIEDIHYKKLFKFIIELQKLKENKLARIIKDASEAYFKIIDHYVGIKKRLKLFSDKLDSLTYLSNENKQQLDSLLEKLNLETVLIYKNEISNLSERKLTEELNYNQKVLSQSDIGFHNIFQDKKNNLLFFDFEYAGWDDCFKMIADLVLQPDYGIETKNFNLLDEILKKYICTESDHKRLLITILIYRIKWTCIILNPLFNNLNEPITKKVNHQILEKSENYFQSTKNKQEIFKLFLNSFY
jgi:thiamine kinase-like enzyme